MYNILGSLMLLQVTFFFKLLSITYISNINITAGKMVKTLKFYIKIILNYNA